LKPTKIPPALILFLLAPTVAELLSGSAPPSEFFNPAVFLLLAILYGSGAVVARELRIRWRKSYGSLLLLGAAYGILEEGLAVKSFFDPNWPDLGVLGVFGRWAEVNWVWAEMLTIYHAVFSITIPVILVELAYPRQRETRWVSDRVLKGLIAALGAVTVFIFLVLTPYVPPWPQFLFIIFLMIAFIFYAYRLPPNWGDESFRKLPRPAFLWAAGFLRNFLDWTTLNFALNCNSAWYVTRSKHGAVHQTFQLESPKRLASASLSQWCTLVFYNDSTIART